MPAELLLKTIDGQEERVTWVEDFKEPSACQFSDLGQLDRRCSLGLQGGFQTAQEMLQRIGLSEFGR